MENPTNTHPSAPKPNIILITVDQMRFPMHFPEDVTMDKGKKTKLGVYTNWAEFTPAQNQAEVLYPTPTIQAPNVDFYAHDKLADESGQPLELVSTPDSAEAQVALGTLYGGPTKEILGLLGFELQKPLPARYQDAQRRAYHKLQHYIQFVNESALASSSTDFAESRKRFARAGAF
jgi:hypothetical protein